MAKNLSEKVNTWGVPTLNENEDNQITGVSIEIETENDIFQEGLREELARILTKLASDVQSGSDLDGLYLRDINGNRVGQVKVSR